MWLRVLSGADAGRTVELPEAGRPFILGRVQGCDLVIRDERASRQHAELRVEAAGGVRVVDLGSANGTFVDGRRVDEALLAGGEELVVGGVETGLRPLAGTEQLMLRRWEGRARARPVTVVGRPIPNDPADATAMLHPRKSALALAVAVEYLSGPFGIEAESGGGRISMWLSVERPELVSRLILAASASETPLDSPMTARMGEWITLAERGARPALDTQNIGWCRA